MKADPIAPVSKRDGVLGRARLLVDIALRVPVEHLAEVRRDIRYGLRTLARSPGFTAVAILSLSVGIAVATGAYSEMNGLVLRSLPAVPQPDALVALQVPTSYPHYKRYRDLPGLFSSTAAYVAPVPFGVSLDGRPERPWGHVFSLSYCATFGVHAAVGRVFDAAAETLGQEPVAVVSYRFWQGHLGS